MKQERRVGIVSHRVAISFLAISMICQLAKKPVRKGGFDL